MKFSIIIPVYNVEKYLEQCLNTTLNQTVDEYEVVCVNDGSTDGSLAILREYEKRFKNLKVIDAKNGGTASARNIGLEHAQGEYVWFVDSDDWIKTDALQTFANCLKVNQPDVLCFNGKLIYEKDKHTEADSGITDCKLTGLEYYNKYALQHRKFHFVCVVLRLYQREFLLENRLFFEKGILHEDNLWIPKMCYYAKSVEIIPDALYFYRIREGSKISYNAVKQIKDVIIVNNQLAEFFIPVTGINKKVLYKVICNDYFGMYNWLISVTNDKKELLDLYEKTNWKIFGTIVRQPEEKLLFNLLKKKRWRLFTFCYHIDFYVVRKIKRKLRE